EFEGHGKGGKDRQKAKVNLFDSSRGGLFNEGNDSHDAGTPPQYRVDVTLDDRKARNRVWQGWAISELDLLEGDDLIKAMIPVLTHNLGKTVRRQPFKIRPAN
ncbi:MAG: hypothetical protein OQK35_07435, partial [Alphaproteobacteria bacterium]|nr:hypothetical protein [Alphaproteobacteria bacterium]